MKNVKKIDHEYPRNGFFSKVNHKAEQTRSEKDQPLTFCFIFEEKSLRSKRLLTSG